MSNLYKSNLENFINSVSILTNIDKEKLIDYSNNHNIHNIIDSPDVLSGISNTQLDKLRQLSKFINSYKIISKYKNDLVKITSSDIAADFLNSLYADKSIERFVMIMMNSNNKVIDTVELSVGTIDSARIYNREIIKTVLKYNASKVILCHNHPSGECEPSREDIRVTKKVVNALSSADVNVFDHIIIGGDTYYSFADYEQMPEPITRDNNVISEKKSIEEVKQSIRSDRKENERKSSSLDMIK